jgi:flagellar M-ring protein FliF
VILVLVLVFVVLLPTIRKLSEAPPPPQYVATEGVGAALPGGGAPGGSLEGGGEALKLPGKGKYEDTLDAARQLVSDDPMRVAQVVRSWVAEDGNH